MLKARDVMVPNPVTVKYDATVMEAVRVMKEKNVASLIVVDDEGRVLGVVTAKDIVLRVLANKLDPESVIMAEVVSKPVTVVEPDAPLKYVINMMIGTGHGHIPVIDSAGRPIGIVTVDDVLKFVPELLESMELKR